VEPLLKALRVPSWHLLFLSFCPRLSGQPSREQVEPLINEYRPGNCHGHELPEVWLGNHPPEIQGKAQATILQGLRVPPVSLCFRPACGASAPVPPASLCL